MAPNASGRGREDEANEKKWVERMFKKQWSPQVFPHCSSSMLWKLELYLRERG